MGTKYINTGNPVMEYAYYLNSTIATHASTTLVGSAQGIGTFRRTSITLIQ
jgi:hypothetical protein